MPGIRIKRGRTREWLYELTHGGIARDITSDTFFFTVKEKHSDADDAALFQLTNDSGITLYDPTNGRFKVTVSPSNTSACPPKRTPYLFDLTAVYADSGAVYTIDEGPFVVEPDITNSTVSGP